MSEDREYGLEDGRADALRTPPVCNPTNSGEMDRESEYATAYLEAYDLTLAEQGLVRKTAGR